MKTLLKAMLAIIGVASAPQPMYANRIRHTTTAADQGYFGEHLGRRPADREG